MDATNESNWPYNEFTVEGNPNDSRDTYFKFLTRMVVTSKLDGGTFYSVLFVNKGETCTSTTAKHQTLQGAEKWARKLLFQQRSETSTASPEVQAADAFLLAAKTVAAAAAPQPDAQPQQWTELTERQYLESTNPASILVVEEQNVWRTKHYLVKSPALTAHADALAEALRLILPMAKAYARANQVGNNQEFIEQAETALAAWDKEAK